MLLEPIELHLHIKWSGKKDLNLHFSSPRGGVYQIDLFPVKKHLAEIESTSPDYKTGIITIIL